MKPHSELLVKKSLLLTLALFFLTCEKQEFIEKAAVSTGGVQDIGIWKAQANGTIIDIGQGITQHGHCWATSQNPTVKNNTTSLGSIATTNVYNSTLTGLEPGVTYYVRAYAIANKEPLYGESVSFTTLDGKAKFGTTTISDITIQSAKISTSITNDGGDAITARGVCWNTTGNPKITDSKTIYGSATGIFTSTLTGLSPNTTYYVSSYATNSVTTTYGNELAFTTRDGTASLTTTAITIITVTSAVSGGDITHDGGDAITVRGVCWNTTGTPTITDNKTIDGSGTGIFTSTLTGLTEGITYYVRSYATNSLGTWYGESRSFLARDKLQDIDGNLYLTVVIGDQEWMAENLKTTKYNDGTAITLITDNTNWANLSTGAYCWYNNDQPAYGNTYGALYNWYAVNTGKLCPTGWHVPSDDEWKTLEIYLGMSQTEADDTGWRGTDEGGKLKEAGTIHWNSPNAWATNESEFSGVPGGGRDAGGYFSNVGDFGLWWSSTEGSTSLAWYRGLYYYIDIVFRSYFNKRDGFSVRCLRD